MSRRRRSKFSILTSQVDMIMTLLSIVLLMMTMLIISFEYANEKDKNRLQAENAEMKVFAGKIKAQKNAISEALFDTKGGEGDFALFIEDLEKLPGDDLHVVLDATGSMESSLFVLRFILHYIVERSKKNLTAVTWFADGVAKTHRTDNTNTLINDVLLQAPFSGSAETINHGLMEAAKSEPLPSAFLLLGDEPSDDGIPTNMPRPVFTLPILGDYSLMNNYKAIAKKFKGRTMALRMGGGR